MYTLCNACGWTNGFYSKADDKLFTDEDWERNKEGVADVLLKCTPDIRHVPEDMFKGILTICNGYLSANAFRHGRQVIAKMLRAEDDGESRNIDPYNDGSGDNYFNVWLHNEGRSSAFVVRTLEWGVAIIAAYMKMEGKAPDVLLINNCSKGTRKDHICDGRKVYLVGPARLYIDAVHRVLPIAAYTECSATSSDDIYRLCRNLEDIGNDYRNNGVAVKLQMADFRPDDSDIDKKCQKRVQYAVIKQVSKVSGKNKGHDGIHSPVQHSKKCWRADKKQYTDRRKKNTGAK